MPRDAMTIAMCNFAAEMMREGVRLSSNGRVHMSSAHTDEQIDQTVEAAGRALARM